MCKPRRWLMSVRRSCGCWGSKHSRISMAFSTELGRYARTDDGVVLGMLRSPVLGGTSIPLLTLLTPALSLVYGFFSPCRRGCTPAPGAHMDSHHTFVC